MDLGVFFSNNLKFNKHIDFIFNKANRQLGIISRIFKNRNSETIIPLYKSVVRPHLEYNSLIWSPWTKTYSCKLERLQRKMCNLIKGNHSLSTCRTKINC